MILDANNNYFLNQILVTRKNVFLDDTRDDPEWRDIPALGNTRSWLCIPLVLSEHLVGLLSVGSGQAGRFTREHLRLAKSLALSAAVAIQNARLYERAEIYAAELELKFKTLKDAQTALEQGHGRSRSVDN